MRPPLPPVFASQAARIDEFNMMLDDAAREHGVTRNRICPDHFKPAGRCCDKPTTHTKVDHYRDTARGRAANLVGSARRRAKQKGLECTVTNEQVEAHILAGCEVTGAPFQLKRSRGGHEQNPFAPSLDRKDPKVGYTPTNTQVVLWGYNMLKGQLSDRHAAQFIHWMSLALRTSESYPNDRRKS